MDNKLKQYLESGNYLPEFMSDFHDQKNLFKLLQGINQRRDDDHTKDVNWVAAHVYTVDIFLWFMAVHGYTLQKSRKKVEFMDIDNALAEFEREQRELKAKILQDAFSKDSNKDTE